MKVEAVALDHIAERTWPSSKAARCAAERTQTRLTPEQEAGGRGTKTSGSSVQCGPVDVEVAESVDVREAEEVEDGEAGAKAYC